MTPIKQFILLSVILAFTACTSNIHEYWDNGKMKSQIEYSDDSKENYIYREYYPTGDIKLQAHYINKKLDGELTTYYKNGNKQSCIKYRYGNKNGTEIIYYKNGSVKSEAKYKKSILVEKTEFKINHKYISK